MCLVPHLTVGGGGSLIGGLKIQYRRIIFNFH